MPLQPEPWLQTWIAPLLKRHSEIEQIYLLGNQARGPFGQKPNYSLLFYAGYDHALSLLTALARVEDELRPADGILHLYVENYGATFCGIWGGALIPNDLNRNWIEDLDYRLWMEISGNSRPLCERLLLPEERRQNDRRDVGANTIGFGAPLNRDELTPIFPDDALVGKERRDSSDRRRDIWDLMPLIES